MARCAGITHAIAITATSTTAAIDNVTVSLDVTPNSSDEQRPLERRADHDADTSGNGGPAIEMGATVRRW